MTLTQLKKIKPCKCTLLPKVLGDSCARNRALVCQEMMNIQTGKGWPVIVLYSGDAKKNGAILNFCPFCRGRVNVEYMDHCAERAAKKKSLEAQPK